MGQNKQARVWAVALQKGGVAKTTTTLSLGVAFARRKARVLLIDMDPQANLTAGLGVESHALENTVYDVLLNPEQGVELAILKAGDVDLVPSTLMLAGAELELAGKIGRELLLRRALARARREYDYILIDTPPSLGVFTLNALAAADAVLVPMQLHPYAFDAIPMLQSTIELMRQLNSELTIEGIVCTLADRRTNICQVIEEKARDTYGDLVYKTVIPQNTKIAESSAVKMAILDYGPSSPGATAYAQLAGEIEARHVQ